MLLRIIYLLLVVVLSISGFTSCEKETIANQATADVFIKSIVFQGDTLYGLAYSAFSFNGIKQVSVKPPQGDSLILPDKVDGGISVFKDPSIEAEDFSSVLPTPGVYTFRVTFKDNVQTSYPNTLGANFLLPAVIDSLGKSQSGQSVVLKWIPVAEAQAYQVKVTKGDTEIIPSKLYAAQADLLRIEFPIASFSPHLPATFTIVLDALMFESSGTRQLQAMSVSLGSIDLQ